MAFGRRTPFGDAGVADEFHQRLEPMSRVGYEQVVGELFPGGPIDMFHLEPNAPDEYQGDFKQIETNVPGRYRRSDCRWRGTDSASATI